MTVVLLSILLAAGAQSPIVEAERLAAEAVRLAPTQPKAALAQARKALALTADFEPTAFVKAGRKGEVVEDEYLAAREDYRRHRSKLYQALGETLLAQGQAVPAARYLRRAVLLRADLAPTLSLAKALLAQGKGRAALQVLEPVYGDPAALPQVVGLVTQAVDAAALPSAQAEIDRARLARLPGGALPFRDGPLALPPGVRLSTAPVVRLDEAPVNLIYVAEASCRTCSVDLQEVKRSLTKDARVLMLPEGDDRDVALRQVLALYRYDWPLLLGKDLVAALKVERRSALIVAREGWSATVVKAPFGQALQAALAALSQNDVAETRPRAGWNRRPVDRAPLPAPPGLTAEGLAPGEDEPAPPDFVAAAEAWRAGRKAEALRRFEALEAAGDGWLLPPEARLDRALCLADLGRRDEARLLLLHTGDSRFQDAVDRALEAVGSPPRPGRR